MSNEYTVVAEKRVDLGKGASRRLRLVSKVPAIIYGVGSTPISLTLVHKDISRQLQNEKFYSRILTVSLDGSDVTAVLKDVQRHPYKPIIMHVDFLRVSATEKITMRVPLHFVGGATGVAGLWRGEIGGRAGSRRVHVGQGNGSGAISRTCTIPRRAPGARLEWRGRVARGPRTDP